MRWVVVFSVLIISLVILMCVASYITLKIKQKADEVYRRSMNLLMTMDDVDSDVAELRAQIRSLSETLDEIFEEVYEAYDEEFEVESESESDEEI